MSKQTVNLGTAPSGSGGDTPRSAFTKTQANVDELYAALGGTGSPAALPAALPLLNGGTGGSTQASACAGIGAVRANVSSGSSGFGLSYGGQPSIATISNQSAGPLTISNAANTGASAVMTFFREGTFGCHLGLDTDNKFKVGGWSYGSVAYTLYHQGTAVGAVSQSSGTPTGALIETGTTSNGTYTKYADGTMICRGISSAALTASNPSGGIFYSGAVGFTFPVAFSTVPTVTVGTQNPTGNFAWASADGTTTASGTTARVVSSASVGSAYITYIAIGRWY